MIRKLHTQLAALGIFVFCFGYFASYIPFSMMTKMLTKGLFEVQAGQGFSGFVIQPMVILATVPCIFIFLSLAGWWKYATHRTIMGVSVPWPRKVTFISGMCTAGVIATTLIAYTFKGISIVFAMLLMRGGVLAMAPVIDLIAKRHRKIYWPSWVAALLSFVALCVSFQGDSGLAMTLVASVNIGLYLLCYFLRLYIMSNYAKSTDVDEKKGYFTEEQTVANVMLLLIMLCTCLVGSQMDPVSIPGQLWYGLMEFPKLGYNGITTIIGITSFGTGLFGGLIFLDHRENTFTVPANRVSSVLAGVVATYLLGIFYGQRYPDSAELWGTALIIVSIVFLAYRTMVEKKRTRAVIIEALT
jgi:hypothetical protein